jgi:hypothetical protein
VHGDFRDEDSERESITSGEIAWYANFFHISYFCGNSASRAKWGEKQLAAVSINKLPAMTSTTQ